MSGPTKAQRTGMGAALARRAELTIITLCIAALVFIFQPFSLTFFTVGAGLVVFGGLAFNLVPLCQSHVPARFVVKVGLIVLAIFLIVILVALGFTELYRLYLRS